MNFLKVIRPDNIRSLRRNVANRNSNSRVARNKVTTRRTRQVVIRTNNPVDAIDTSTLTTSATRIITYTNVIQRARHRFISVSTLRRVFRLQVSKHNTVNIDKFSHNLVHDVHEQSNAITNSPNHTTFIAKHRLPRHLLVNSKTNQITVRVAVFKINFKARAPRVTATRVFGDAWDLTRRHLSNKVLFNGHLFGAGKVSIRQRLTCKFTNTRA